MQLLNCNKSWKSKGSITVEACITLPAFLCIFFLLLFVVKLVCTGMVLDYAVNETAKEIAASAYPVSILNEFEEAKLEEYGAAQGETGQQVSGVSYMDILKLLVSGNSNGADAAGALKEVMEAYSGKIAGGLIDSLTPAYWDMKSKGKYAIAEAILEEHLDSPLINRDKVRLRLVEFPQSKPEYDAGISMGKYEGSGLVPGEDFNMDDTVVQLEYSYIINLPFNKAHEIKMVYTAVERGWINGSSGILTSEEEGLDLEPEGSIVYITRTGIRYHRGSCWYLRRSKLPVEIEEAKERGYTPCKVCKPAA